jgi:cytochrome c oxidase subunit 2
VVGTGDLRQDRRGTRLKIDQIGRWHGECAELCGAGHSTMQIIVQSMAQNDYDNWVKAQLAVNTSAAGAPALPS